MVLLSDKSLQNKSSLKKFFYLTVFSVFFSLWAFLLSAPFLRVIRKAFGPLAYWLLGAVFVAALIGFKMLPMSIFVASFWMTLGAYNEFEQRGLSWNWSGPISIVSGLLVASLGAWLLTRNAELSLIEQLNASAAEVVDSIKQVNPKLEIDPSQLVQAIPAALISVLIVALGVSLIFESRIFRWMSLPRERVASQLKLLEYKVPEPFVWIALLGFLFSFENFGIQWLSVLGLNVTIISIVLYFFQGLSVLEVFLLAIKGGVFSRILAYVVFIMQLPMLLSVVGFIDYWVDMRKRLRKVKAL